jgi:hypothetical protein
MKIAARRNTVSAAVDGAETFLGTEVSLAIDGGAACARSTPYASGKVVSDKAGPAIRVRTYQACLIELPACCADGSR